MRTIILSYRKWECVLPHPPCHLVNDVAPMLSFGFMAWDIYVGLCTIRVCREFCTMQRAKTVGELSLEGHPQASRLGGGRYKTCAAMRGKPFWPEASELSAARSIPDRIRPSLLEGGTSLAFVFMRSTVRIRAERLSIFCCGPKHRWVDCMHGTVSSLCVDSYGVTVGRHPDRHLLHA